MSIKQVFVVVRRPKGADNAWQLGRIFTTRDAADEYMEHVQLGSEWESSCHVENVWNDAFLTS
jgi:hypothetical protein